MRNKKKHLILNPISMLVIGLLIGYVVKQIDIRLYVQHFGVSLSDIFSQAGIWVVLGVAISLYSPSRKYAMLNVFTFCGGMLIAYYVTAELTGAVYSWTYIKGWAIFTCLTPLLAFLVTLTKDKGVWPAVIKFAVLAGYLVMNLILVGSLKVYDFIFLAFLVYLLFFKRFK